MYDLTACVVTYNTKHEELRKVIRCFQKIGIRFKLWISDNSEKDDLRDFIEGFLDDRIEYIFNNSNNGFGAGHNIVIEKLIQERIESEFHLMVNADVFFEENTIEKIVEYMKNPKNADKYIRKIAKDFGCGKETVRVALKKLGYTRKKNRQNKGRRTRKK